MSEGDFGVYSDWWSYILVSGGIPLLIVILAYLQTLPPTKIFLYSTVYLVICIFGSSLHSYMLGVKLGVYSGWWSYILILGIPLLFAILAYLYTLPLTIYLIVRRNVSKRWVLVVLTVPFAMFLTRYIPGFADGVRDTIRSKVTPEELYSFSEKVRGTYHKVQGDNFDYGYPRINIQKAGSIMRALEVSNPTVNEDGVVMIEQRLNHDSFWAIEIGKSCSHFLPTHNSLEECLEIYPGVWVLGPYE